MKLILQRVGGAFLVGGLLLATGCNQEDRDKAKENVSNAADQTSDALKTASEKVSDAAKTAGEKIKDGAQKAVALAGGAR